MLKKHFFPLPPLFGSPVCRVGDILSSLGYTSFSLPYSSLLPRKVHQNALYIVWRLLGRCARRCACARPDPPLGSPVRFSAESLHGH